MKITLYVKAGASIKKWRKFVSKEIALARNIKSKDTRDSVFLSLRAIRNALQAMKRIGDRGIVFFAEDGNVDSEIPPQPISFSSYFCGNKFITDPLDDIIDQSKGEYTGVVVIDAREAAIGVARGDFVLGLYHKFSQVMGKHRAGGQSSQRFQRGREEQLKEWRRKIARMAVEIWRDYRIQEVVVGGAGFEKKRLAKELELPRPFRFQVHTVNSEYCDDVYGLKEAWARFTTNPSETQ